MVDPICKQEIDALLNSSAVQQLLRAPNNLYRKNPKRFLRVERNYYSAHATAISGKADAIAAVPPPTADAALIGQWIVSLRVDASNHEALATSLPHKDNRLTKKWLKRLTNGQISVADHTFATEQIIAGYGFQYC